MQVVKCTIALAGNRNTTVRREATVAEIEILRALHGDDAISEVVPRRMDKREHAYELDRLRRFYRKHIPGTGASGVQNIVDAVYPGPRPKLPGTLSDIGLSRSEVDDSDSGKKRSGKKRSDKQEPDTSSGDDGQEPGSGFGAAAGASPL